MKKARNHKWKYGLAPLLLAILRSTVGRQRRQYVLQTDLDHGKQQETVQGAYKTCKPYRLLKGRIKSM
jgi:hypothetical protein